MHSACMPSVTIRDLPRPVHLVLTRRAEEAGLSLQQYLVAELTRLTSRPTMADVIARIEGRRGGRVGSTTAVADLDEERRAG